MPTHRKAHLIDIGRANTGRSVETDAQVKARERRIAAYEAAVCEYDPLPYPQREKGT